MFMTNRERKPLENTAWLMKRLNVNRDRAYQLVRERAIPGIVRLGRQVRIDTEVVEEFIRSGGTPDSGDDE